MAAGDTVHSYIHTDDNQVQYFTTFKGAGGERKEVPHRLLGFNSDRFVLTQIRKLRSTSVPHRRHCSSTVILCGYPGLGEQLQNAGHITLNGAA